MDIKLEDGNVKDVEVTEVTAQNYIVPENEKHLFHVKIEQKAFSPTDGKRLSKPRVQKFGVKMFRRCLDDIQRQGYTVEMLYNPTEYLANLEKEKISVQKSIAKAERKKEIDDAVNAALKKQEETLTAIFEKKMAEMLEKQTKKSNK